MIGHGGAAQGYECLVELGWLIPLVTGEYPSTNSAARCARTIASTSLDIIVSIGAFFDRDSQAKCRSLDRGSIEGSRGAKHQSIIIRASLAVWAKVMDQVNIGFVSVLNTWKSEARI